ncbi:MAG TPA: RNA polymerase sigma-70 factor [Flavitalea sp.]|nr:RNA polymerase sigma-70 factor [Flavitalea sp.]
MERYLPYEEKDLLRQVAEGNEVAFRQLYDRYKNQAYSFALGITRSTQVAKEIVQESFIKLWLHRKALQNIKQFESWFFVICRNLCYDALRKMALDYKIRLVYEKQAEYQVITADEIVIDRENRELIHAAISQLPEQQRRVYMLSREAGLTYEEIAVELNISRNTVKEHLRRAVAAIKAYLEMRLAVIITLLALPLP